MARNGYRFRVSPGFVLLLAAAELMTGTEKCVMMLLAAAVHELGHIAALQLSGAEITGICAGAQGFELKYEPGKMSYLSDALTALSGPAASFTAASVSAAAGNAYFAGLNLLFFTFNMLPMSVTDGGKTLYALNSALFGAYEAEKIKTVLDAFLCISTVLSGVFVLWKYRNPTLVICASAMCISCCKSTKSSVKFKG